MTRMTVDFDHRWLRPLGAAVLVLVLSGAGCHPRLDSGPPARIEAGVVIGEDGVPYMAVGACSSRRVAAMEWFVFTLEPGTSVSVDDSTPALGYEFDPPVPLSHALGPLDPAVSVTGATRTAYDPGLAELGLQTTTPPDDVDAKSVPYTSVNVLLVDDDDESTWYSSYWHGDQREEGTFYGEHGIDDGAVNWDCGGDPIWDFSLVDG